MCEWFMFPQITSELQLYQTRPRTGKRPSMKVSQCRDFGHVVKSVRFRPLRSATLAFVLNLHFFSPSITMNIFRSCNFSLDID